MVNKILLNIRNGERKTDIEFPCMEKEMAEALEKIAIPDLNAPKVYVSEVVELTGLSMLESKALNLDEVNYLANYWTVLCRMSEIRYMPWQTTKGMTRRRNSSMYISIRTVIRLFRI